MIASVPNGSRVRIAGWRRRLGLLAVAAVGALFAGRPPDAAAADPAAREVAASRVEVRLAAAATLLGVLADDAADAFATVRDAAAAVRSGPEDPGALYEEAEREWRQLERRVPGTTARLEEARPPDWCRTEAAVVLPLDATAAARVAEALEAAAPQASAIFRFRSATVAVLDRLGVTLAALERGEHRRAARAALDATDALDEAREAYRGLEAVMPTAAIWLDTTGTLIAAAAGLASARTAGDDATAAAADQAYRRAADGAPLADRALDVALAEGSAATTGPVLADAGRASDVMAERAAAVAGLAEGGVCR
ncbi:MAG: hypothetical protein ABR509_01590 [Candidatus Limnocylindria bacterium]